MKGKKGFPMHDPKIAQHVEELKRATSRRPRLGESEEDPPDGAGMTAGLPASHAPRLYINIAEGHGYPRRLKR